MQRWVTVASVVILLPLGYWWSRGGSGAVVGGTPQDGAAVSQSEPTRVSALGAALDSVPPLATSVQAFYDPVVVAPCNLLPFAEQDVSSQTEGAFEEVLVELGQRVTRGQLLGRLDDRQLRPQVELLQIKAASRSGELIARALHAEADGKVQYALEANKSGLKAVPDLEYQTYLHQRERYAQEMNKAREEREAAEKELERAQRTLELHEIRSALSGEIVKVYKRTGEAVKQGEPLFRVADFSRLRVEGLCKSSQASLIRAGMPALVEPELRGAQMTRLSGHTGTVNSLAMSGDGRLLASASDDRTVIVWAWPQGVQRAHLQHPAEVLATAFAALRTGGSGPGPYVLLTGCADAQARLWSVSAAGKVEGPTCLRGHEGPIRAVAFSPDGRRCATAGEDKRIALWNVADAKLLGWLHSAADGESAHFGAVTAVHFTPDDHLVSAGRDNVLKVWRLAEEGGQLVHNLSGRGGDVSQLGLSADGLRMLFDHGEELRILDRRDGRCLGTLQGRKQSQFQGLALFAPSGRLVLAGANNGRLQLWRAPATPEEAAFFRHGYGVGFDRGSLAAFGALHGIAASGNLAGGLTTFATLTGERSPSPRLWRLDSAEVRHFLTPGGSVTCGAFAPDESVIFTGGGDKLIRVWQVPAVRLWERQLEARITFVGSEVERGTDMVRVRAEVANPADPACKLRPGTYASLRLYPETAIGE